MHPFSQPPLRLGILGGGQLGHMLLTAAAPFQLHTRVLDGDAQAPCRHLAQDFINAPFSDEGAVKAFGLGCDVVTVEIEHVSVPGLAALEQKGIAVHPSSKVLALVQDKGAQKQFYRDKGIPTAPFVLAENRKEALAAGLFPAFQKLRRSGYDGRGVVRLGSPADSENAFDAPSVLEAEIAGAREISVLVARNPQGQVRAFPPVELVFHPVSHLVSYLWAPAELPSPVTVEAEGLARRVIEEISMVGLLAVEMFLTRDGRLLVNEIAPRPHNSGHHTIRANHTSQYEQHLRAILGLPLGDPGTLCPSAMVNLLGAEGHRGPVKYEGLEELMAMDGMSIQLYGKSETRPMRKMGHVTILDPDLNRLREKIRWVQERVRVVS